MTYEEHREISRFIAQVVDEPSCAPMDVEADAIIRALFVRNPDAAYRMTMLALSLSRPPALAVPVAERRVAGFLRRPRG